MTTSLHPGLSLESLDRRDVPSAYTADAGWPVPTPFGGSSVVRVIGIHPSEPDPDPWTDARSIRATTVHPLGPDPTPWADAGSLVQNPGSVAGVGGVAAPRVR